MPDNFYVLVIVAMLGTFLIVVSFLAVFIRNQKALLSQREASQLAAIEYQKNLLKAVVESQEEERKRIGKDLHDDVGTSLSTLKLNINQILREPQDEAQVEKLQSTFRVYIDKIISDVRTISHRLTPEILTINTLSEALTELLTALNRSGEIVAIFEESDLSQLDIFTVHDATNIYRTVEELVNNTIKHSGASQISIGITATPDQLLLSYWDNGRGNAVTAPKSKGRGMRNIESRLGLLNAEFTVDGLRPGYAAKISLPKPSAHGTH